MIAPNIIIINRIFKKIYIKIDINNIKLNVIY